MKIDAQLPGSKTSEYSRILWWIIGIATIMRLYGITAFSLSNDELSALARLQYDSVSDVITDGVYPDFHPAGVQLFLYFWTSVFGFSEWMVRLPFALLGIGSVYLIYRIGRYWFGEPTGILAAAALAVLDYPILYSQIARPYSPGLFFSLLATFFWTRSIFVEYSPENKRAKYLNFIGFALAVVACMYIHYFSFIFAGLLCFTGLFFLKRNTIAPYLLSGVAIVILYLPHIEIFTHQLSKGGVGGASGWLGPPGEDAFGKYLNYCFNDSYQLKLLFFIITTGTVLLYRKELRLNRFHLISVALFILPFLIAYYYSIWKNPVFQHSVLLFSFPFLLLFLFSFIPRNAGKFTSLLLIFCVLVGGVYSTVYEKNYYTSQHFSEFRGIAKHVKELDNKLGSANITKTINVFNPYYIQYYFNYFNHQGKFDMYRIMTDEEKIKFRNLVEQTKTPYFLHAFSNTYDDPQFDMIIRSRFPWIISRDSTLGSGLRLYSRQQSDSALNRIPLYSLGNNFEKGIWEGESEFRDSSIQFDGRYSLQLTPKFEYSPGIKFKLSDLGIKAGTVLEIDAIFYSDSIPKGCKLVLSIDKGEQMVLWTASSPAEFGGEPGKWIRVYVRATVPDEVVGDERLNIYCWNEKKETFWMDDFHLKIY